MGPEKTRGVKMYVPQGRATGSFSVSRQMAQLDMGEIELG